jgi:hypothetical protein
MSRWKRPGGLHQIQWGCACRLPLPICPRGVVLNGFQPRGPQAEIAIPDRSSKKEWDRTGCYLDYRCAATEPSSRHARQSPVEPARVRRLVVPDNLCETVVRVQLSRDWHWLTTYKCHANYSLAIRRGRDHHRRCGHRSHETLQTGVLAIVARFEWWAPERSETESSTLADRQCSNDHSFHIMLLPMFPFL